MLAASPPDVPGHILPAARGGTGCGPDPGGSASQPAPAGPCWQCPRFLEGHLPAGLCPSPGTGASLGPGRTFLERLAGRQGARPLLAKPMAVLPAAQSLALPPCPVPGWRPSPTQEPGTAGAPAPTPALPQACSWGGSSVLPLPRLCLRLPWVPTCLEGGWGTRLEAKTPNPLSQHLCCLGTSCQAPVSPEREKLLRVGTGTQKEREEASCTYVLGAPGLPPGPLGSWGQGFRGALGPHQRGSGGCTDPRGPDPALSPPSPLGPATVWRGPRSQGKLPGLPGGPHVPAGTVHLPGWGPTPRPASPLAGRCFGVPGRTQLGSFLLEMLTGQRRGDRHALCSDAEPPRACPRVTLRLLTGRATSWGPEPGGHACPRLTALRLGSDTRRGDGPALRDMPLASRWPPSPGAPRPGSPRGLCQSLRPELLVRLRPPAPPGTRGPGSW